VKFCLPSYAAALTPSIHSVVYFSGQASLTSSNAADSRNALCNGHFLGFWGFGAPSRRRPEGHKFGLRFENVLYNLSGFEVGCGPTGTRVAKSLW